MAQRRQGKFGCERQRCEHRTRIDGAIIGPVGHATCCIAEKTAFPTVDLQCLETGPVVCRDTPTVLAIAFKPERITPCVFALHIRGAPAIFEIVALFLAHEEIAYAGKIDPGLRKMVNEEWPRIKKFVIVDVFPLIGRSPFYVAALWKGMCRRCQTKNIENDRLVIAIPAIMQKSALRLPSLPDGRSTAARPLPIDATVNGFGTFANLILAWRVRVEIYACGQPPRQQQCGVDQRHF